MPVEVAVVGGGGGSSGGGGGGGSIETQGDSSDVSTAEELDSTNH